MTATIDQWMMMKFYDDKPSPADYDQSLFDQISAMEGLIPDVNDTGVLSSSPSPTSPKACGNIGSKPIRRRSRASKKTPTTLLNANTANFRALVQQFTGCPSTTAMSFDVYKGPITLNFKQGSRQVVPRRHHHHHNKSRTTTVSPAPATAKMGFNGNSGLHHHLHQYQQQKQQQEQQQQWRLQDHQRPNQHVDDILFDDDSDLFSSSMNSSSVSDGLIMDHNDYSTQDLTNNAFFPTDNDVIIQNGAYYM